MVGGSTHVEHVDAAQDVSVDGRRARRERGRRAVIDAAFELLQEGRVPPPVDEVADRAGVSTSTIFRYFEGLDDMQHQALARFHERFDPLFTIPGVGEGPLPDRIAAFVDRRLELYGHAGSIMSVARLRAIEHPAMAEAASDTRRALAAQVARQFAPELDAATPARRADLAAVVDSLTSPEAWDATRRGHDRTATQIRRAWVDALTRLLGAPAEPTEPTEPVEDVAT